ARIRGKLARALLAGPAPEPRWFALCAAAEELFASRLGAHGRRAAGLYYTPPEIAEEVVALALRHGSARTPRAVLDPCAGAAAFLLRSLELVEPGGTAALLVPDTWMTNSRAGALRASLLDAAEIAAVCDLGKPFAAAKDTRVHAVVLVRRSSARMRSRPTRVLRGSERLADTSELELRQTAERGWQVYRSPTERRLCKAMEQNGVSLRELCQVGYGLRTGDNPRFVARRAPRPDELALVGGEDVLPFALRV